jgi:hypothetical protein
VISATSVCPDIDPLTVLYVIIWPIESHLKCESQNIRRVWRFDTEPKLIMCRPHASRQLMPRERALAYVLTSGFPCVGPGGLCKASTPCSADLSAVSR